MLSRRNVLGRRLPTLLKARLCCMAAEHLETPGARGRSVTIAQTREGGPFTHALPADP